MASDSRVKADGISDDSDICTCGRTYFGNRVDKGDLGGEEGVRRGLHKLRARRVSDDEGSSFVKDWRVDLTDQRLSGAVGCSPQDKAVGVQRVDDCMSLP